MTTPLHADNAPPSALSALQELLTLRGDQPLGSDELTIRGNDPFFKIPFHLGETTAAVLGATGIAVNDIWEQRTGARQRISVDVRHAAATVRTVDYTRKRMPQGHFEHIPVPTDMSYMLTVTQPWKTRDDRWFLPHFNLPHLARRVLGVLGSDYTPQAVQQAVSQWNSSDLEEAIAQVRACGAIIRTQEEWLAHPQGQYLANRPVIEITKIADSEPEPIRGTADRPLSGLRALDLTRILAGPITGRTLAEHGADVLMVTGKDLPQTPEHVRDTSHGKRSCFLDIKDAHERLRIQELARTADVFINGYRPGRLQDYGLGVEELAQQRPGLIYVSISCYGSGGPFADRSGWEQVAQAATGICHTYGESIQAGQPKLVFAPVCDYTTGYLGALGTLIALRKRAEEGGSYHVQVSLCQSSMFIQRRGLLEDFSNAPERLTEAELEKLFVEAQSSYGLLRTLGPALGMSHTPPYWATPTPALGADLPQWR